jgi:hypothetical protein
MPHPPTGPASLLASLPAHLGRPLQPPEAVVLGWTDNAPEHVAVVYLNLADDDPLDEVELARAIVIDGAEAAAVVVAVTDRSDRSFPTAASHARFVALHRFGVNLLDVLTVVGDRWRSLSCTDPACCPPEGSPMPHAATTEETL